MDSESLKSYRKWESRPGKKKIRLKEEENKLNDGAHLLQQKKSDRDTVQSTY